jgi:transcriptional regulator GlxA family with amidase domain
MPYRSVSFAVLAYDGIEPIDIGATYGVLSMAKRIAPTLSFFVISKAGGEIEMANGLRLIADYSFDSCPAADILIVLGGPGWEQASKDASTLEFIHRFSQRGAITAAVCTGSMILAAAGLLDGKSATTKREVLPSEIRPLTLLGERYPKIDAIEARLVDAGSVLTGGGVSLGIDMTLHLLSRFVGPELADETARILEYRIAWQANSQGMADVVLDPGGRR